MKMKMFRKMTVVALSLAMVITSFAAVPFTSFAEDDEQERVTEEFVQEAPVEAPEETAEAPSEETEEPAEKEEQESRTKLEAIPEELVLNIKVTPTNRDTLKDPENGKGYDTATYKYGKPGVLTFIFQAEWADQAAIDALVADGYTVTYDLWNGGEGGKVVAKNIDIVKGYKLKIPTENTGYKIVATITKGEGETAETEAVETITTNKVVWRKTPTDVKAKCGKKSNDVTITWDAVKSANAYYIYRKASKKTPGKPLTYLSENYIEENGCKYVDKNLPGKKKYYYYVQSVDVVQLGGEGNYYHPASNLSKAATVTVNKFLTCNIRPIGWHTTMKSTVSLYNGKTGGGTHGKVKKGTKVDVTEKYPAKIPYGSNPSRIKISFKKNGKKVTGWVKYSNAKGGVFATVAYKKKKALDWPVEQKENYVNNKEYDSSTSYLIWVSTYTQRVNIFKGSKGNWKLVRSSRCVTGVFKHLTKIGSGFSIWKHQKTRVRNFYQSTGQYYYHNLSYFSKGNSFHTVCWRVGSGKQVNFIKKTLQPGTRGCCRMYVPDATWIYNNIPMKTKVVVR